LLLKALVKLFRLSFISKEGRSQPHWASSSFACQAFGEKAHTEGGQHGVATATTVCARFGLQCVVYMGAQDMEGQALNVFDSFLILKVFVWFSFKNIGKT
jgi:hypothetical protein